MAQYGTHKYPKLKDRQVPREDAKVFAEAVVTALWDDIVSSFKDYSDTPLRRDEALRVVRMWIQGLTYGHYKIDCLRNWSGCCTPWRQAGGAIYMRRHHLYEKRTGQKWPTHPELCKFSCPPNLHVEPGSSSTI